VIRILWKVSGRILAISFRLLPRRQRFAAAVRLTRVLQYVLRHSQAHVTRERLRTDTIRETTLDLILMMLERHGTEFDPQMIVIGDELLPHRHHAAATLIAVPHTMLSKFIVRHLTDRGHPLVTISADPIKIPGTRTDAHILLPSRTLLVKVRDLLQNGATVAAMIDRGTMERRNTSVATARGELLVSTPLLEVALRQRARIVFLSAMFDAHWNVTMHVVEPPQNASTTVPELVAAFAGFVDTYVHASSGAPASRAG
jgi:hypothetical protein